VTESSDRDDLGQEVERLRGEVSRLNAALDAERAHAEQWREVAEERRVTLERIRQHPAVRLLLALSRLLGPIARRTVRAARRIARVPRRIAAGATGLPHRLTAGSRADALRERLGDLPPPPPDTRPVSVIVLTRDGRRNLERLLPALRRSAHAPMEIVVLDNGSGHDTRDFLEAQDDVQVVRSERNLTFSAGNNRAAEVATGEVLCFLNDDIEPADEGWLDRMLAALHGDVAAVGAQLVYPRRPLRAMTRTRDIGVQHRGIEFDPVSGGVPEARNIGGGAEPVVETEPVPVAAATAACLLVRREDFLALGGFDTGYVYGAEDVDLCWRLRQRGGRIVVTPDAVLYHHEGATRHREDPAVLHERQTRNWDRLAERFGPQITRAVELDRLRGEKLLASRPYEVAITITRDMPEAGYGDWYTAHELGEKLEAIGWSVRYVEKYRDAWYEIDERLDAVVVLLDTYDIRKVARPGLTTIAWVRNWTERWISTPWFDDFDVVLVAGERSAELVRERSRHRPVVMPLATNPERFGLEGAGVDGELPTIRRRVVFPGNYWGRDTRVDELVEAVPDLEIFGKGWEEIPEVAERWRGHIDYARLPGLYRESIVVVDQAAVHTRGYGSLNSRVFDAIAAGAVPVTNQIDGARELFGDRLPVYETPEELAGIVRELGADPEAAAERAAELRETVLAGHTYTARAVQLREVLADRAQAASVVLKTSAPSRDVAATWGDWHLADALAREVRARGHVVALQTADEWDARWGRAHDVAVHLKGRSRVRRADGQVHVVWNISHPEELTPEECDEADLVLVASRTFPDELRLRTTTTVEVLLQATDERRFRPLSADPRHSHDVGFVGNSRFVMRPVIRDAIAAGLRPAIYGGNWERYVDPDLVVSTFVANEDLPEVYSSLKILLNDHWEGMRRHGFISNRIFDALACAACVVSDEHEELTAVFGDAVATYRRPEDLRETVDRLLAEPETRHAMGARGRDAVLSAHTFSHRADELIAAFVPLVDEEHGGRREHGS
jgi:O-antigen biosynthesis protein